MFAGKFGLLQRDLNCSTQLLHCGIVCLFLFLMSPQVGWSTARDYYTFVWSPMPENYEPGSTVHRAVVFQGTAHARTLTYYLNHYTNPGYSKVTPPFYSAYKNQHFYLIREHDRKLRPGT